MAAASRHPPLPVLPPLTDGAWVRVAFSGGLDSTVLLHQLVTAGITRLAAIHVHHGLQSAADDWAAHCEATCAALGVPLEVLRANIAADDVEGPEAAARSARYALLRSAMADGDLLVTGHHRADQAETVLLRLLRGTGVHGLAAMRSLVDFAPGRLWRPLLDQPRAVLLAYATANHLRWLDDPHNRDPRYARSWLRTEVMPQLRARHPQVDAALARSARLADEAAGLLDELAAADLAALAQGEALAIPGLLSLSPARRHNLVRHWLAIRGFRPPFAAMLDRLDRELLAAAVDADPRLRWPGCELRRHRQRLYAMTPLDEVAGAQQASIWNEGSRHLLPGGTGELVAASPPPWPLTVRRPRPGETIRPAGDRMTRDCRTLFQARGIPVWARTRMPVLDAGDGCLCIIGLAATDRWQAAAGAAGWSVEWRHALAGLPNPIRSANPPLHPDCP